MTKSQPSLAHIASITKSQTSIMGESMAFYTKKVDEKILSLKKDNFSQKHKKLDSIFT
jgi:hypothetical protein